MTNENTVKLTVRIAPALHEALQREAAQDARSVNAEIIILLREALAQREAARRPR